jgi:hypothetical protein
LVAAHAAGDDAAFGRLQELNTRLAALRAVRPGVPAIRRAATGPVHA